MSTLDDLARAEKKREPYVSKFDEQRNNILSQIGQGFSYDFNADPVYQGYRKEFSQLAATGQANANADTQAMSGGLGTTYGAQASAQAAQQYRTTMNDIIPKLYEAALDKYDAQQKNLSAQFGMMGDEENRLYGMYRDQIADDRADRNYYYGKAQDEVKQDQWQKQFDYTGQRDKVKDEQWQKEFDESKRQFDLNYALKQAAAARGRSGGGGRGKSSKKKTTTQVAALPSRKDLLFTNDLADRVSMGYAAANPITYDQAVEAQRNYDMQKEVNKYSMGNMWNAALGRSQIGSSLPSLFSTKKKSSGSGNH